MIAIFVAVVAYVVGLFAFHRYVVIKTAQHKHQFSGYITIQSCSEEFSSLWCDRNDDRIALFFVGVFWPIAIPAIGIIRGWMKAVNRPTKAQKKFDKEQEKEERLREVVAHLSSEDKKFLGIK